MCERESSSSTMSSSPIASASSSGSAAHPSRGSRSRSPSLLRGNSRLRCPPLTRRLLTPISPRSLPSPRSAEHLRAPALHRPDQPAAPNAPQARAPTDLPAVRRTPIWRLLQGTAPPPSPHCPARAPHPSRQPHQRSPPTDQRPTDRLRTDLHPHPETHHPHRLRSISPQLPDRASAPADAEAPTPPAPEPPTPEPPEPLRQHPPPPQTTSTRPCTRSASVRPSTRRRAQTTSTRPCTRSASARPSARTVSARPHA